MALYDQPHQFTPLLPSEAKIGPLLERASELVRSAGAASQMHVPVALRKLLRSMNSYYSNKIEGQHTRPAEIERALRRDFSANSDLARRQRLAISHIEAEEQLEAEYLGAEGLEQLWRVDALCSVHRELFGRLPPEDLADENGNRFEPGALRQRDVEVGMHVAPAHASVPAFIASWGQTYSHVRQGEMTVVAIAASHHRLAWIHPFPDGNGRVSRLHTHLALHSLGYLGGIWSPLRGFARTHEQYYQTLAHADEPRMGDLDGRGNLSERALMEWITYVLDVCIDQCRFMQESLQMGTMLERIRTCLVVEELRSTGVRQEAAYPLHYLLQTGGELDRGAFVGMMSGMGDRTARAVLSSLINRGLLESDSPRGKVRFGVPHHALRFYFPSLWPEAEAEAEA
ncbi:MAG: cell filamentation protein Fic [Burkholderiales bacterium PBB6]|nr:MAG: cell filamentation protein Fic [Burkholderiales bacterium PBB6]